MIIAIIPMYLIFLILFSGVAVSAQLLSDATAWITRNFALIGWGCVIFFVVAIVWEYRIVKNDKKCKINTVVFFITNIFRTVFAAGYMLPVIYASASTFRSMNIFDTLLLLFEIPFLLLPTFAYFGYEKVIEFEPSNGGAVFGSIISALGSFLGIAFFELFEYIMPTINAMI